MHKKIVECLLALRNDMKTISYVGTGTECYIKDNAAVHDFSSFLSSQWGYLAVIGSAQVKECIDIKLNKAPEKTAQRQPRTSETCSTLASRFPL